ncbi:hypothetical protein F5Y17DRAFT_454901 [Xylariaceae sp. FL0594]|nr:hypothetical protein F5Y17DRAFT_454901 [Xylariaceae sp. FL0594]
MSSPLKKHPEAVADRVLKRVEMTKIARRLQGCLALAKFKTRHGWEDLTLDIIEPKIEERRRRFGDGDVLSDSSSSTSEFPYPTRTLMSSPLKAPLFSDAITSSNGSTGHRKRTYTASFDMTMSSPAKRFRSSPTPNPKSFQNPSQGSWRKNHQLIQSSPIKPRRQHFTTSNGPDVSFFQGTRRPSVDLTATPNFAAPDEEDDLLPLHSFQIDPSRSSPPRTPPMRPRSINIRRGKDAKVSLNEKSEEGADLLMYLATSPSPAMSKTRMEPPSTPPQRRDMALPSSMMTTPGGGNFFPSTPGQPFDFADFVNITPSPAQKPWKTPLAFGSVKTPTAKTPVSLTRRKLTFDETVL